jgi:hypothetical protein
MLITSISDRESADLDFQIDACLLCEANDVETDPDDYKKSVDRITGWLERERALAAAGIGGSQPRVQKRLLNRIDAAIASVPPHVRASRSRIAARARNVATSQHGPAIEAELDLLAHSRLPDHEWLATVAALGSDRTADEQERRSIAKLTIHALLLLHATPREGDRIL